MHIGIDATCWNNRRGFGRYTREVLLALHRRDTEHRYIYFIPEGVEPLVPYPEQVETVPVRQHVSPIKAASSEGRRSIRDMLAFTRAVYNRKPDLFYFPAVYSYFPMWRQHRTVVTIHDTIARKYPDETFKNHRRYLSWVLKEWAAVKQAHHIQTVSSYSSREIERLYHVKQNHISFLYEAAEETFRTISKDDLDLHMLQSHGLSPDTQFLLYVGGISPHKNLHRCVTAFRTLAESGKHPGLKLVLVGDYTNDSFYSEYGALSEHCRAQGVSGDVIFTGYISDNDLAHFYNAAALLVFPSLDEGFGLPAVEAMSCGLPVAASRRGSLPEVLEDAARYFDPLDTADMAWVISGLLADPETRRTLSQAGLQRAAEFSWDKAGAALLNLFNSLR